jgi:peptide/nickel transport system permease protein
LVIDDEIAAPPFAPSTVFPWGTDHIGRDVQALVLAGARQTLMLAVFGMLARVLVGTILGMLAGWWRESWLDRLVTGAVGVWAAFPYTLFAMIVIQALGIQQGMWVFVVALCVVGWGEVAQFVRGQVIGIKPRQYIEASRAVGARPAQILSRHVLPNLLAALLVLAILEMGGVLMLLSELGFLNIFLGGGYQVEIADEGMAPVIAYFSDIPEWGALLANVRDWWRSYPWMAWYPGVAFFLTIVTFNVWGEGLRRFLAEGRVNLSRLFNRYTAVATVVAVLGLVWGLRSTCPLGVYWSQAKQFDAQRAMEDIQVLTSPEFQGREAGTPGAELAAQYIAERMKEIGLAAGGENESYVVTVDRSTYRLAKVPGLQLLDDQGNVVETLTYREDFVEYAGPERIFGAGEGAVIGLVTGPLPDTSSGDPYGLRNYDIWDKVILVREAGLEHINIDAPVGTLVVSDDPLRFQRKFLFGYNIGDGNHSPPVTFVTPEAADRLLATAGSSLAEMDDLAADLRPGEVALTDPGATVRLETMLEGDITTGFIDLEDVKDLEFDAQVTVIGFIPGAGAQMEATPGVLMSDQVIMIGAYYDGLGFDFNGEIYPGANDNASGVATMLEIARVLKESPHPPKRTVVFVAWSGGERHESMSVSNVMNAAPGLRSLSVEAVIELSGVGAGSGKEIVLGQGSSYRLVQLFQKAASRVETATTTRGRGPHYGIFADVGYRGTHYNISAALGYGGRSALTAYVHWDGSDRTAHTLEDTFEAIDSEKLEQVGQTTLLALTVLSRELDY